MSKVSQRHTLEDLARLSEGGPEEQIREALTHRKGGLNPVHAAVLMAATQSGRVLEILGDEQPQADGPAPIQRIESLLEAIVGKLETIDRRIAALEHASRPQPTR